MCVTRDGYPSTARLRCAWHDHGTLRALPLRCAELLPLHTQATEERVLEEKLETEAEERDSSSSGLRKVSSAG
jgi:hypothetical protein